MACASGFEDHNNTFFFIHNILFLSSYSHETTGSNKT